MNVSLLQSQVALNRAVINSLHENARECIVDLHHLYIITSYDVQYVQKELDKISKQIAKYVKLQKALKKQIAEIVSAQRNPFAALRNGGFTAEEAAEYLENTDTTLFGYLKQPDGTFLASDLKKLKMELRGIL